MQDKHRYVEEITKRKLQILEEIKEIDNKINNKDLLEKEYIIRNEILPLNKKIFSMRVLSNIMIEEREKKYKKIEELNEIMKPTKLCKTLSRIRRKKQIPKILRSRKQSTRNRKHINTNTKNILKMFPNKNRKSKHKTRNNRTNI